MTTLRWVEPKPDGRASVNGDCVRHHITYTPGGYMVAAMKTTVNPGRYLRFAAATGMGGCGRCRRA